MDISQGQLILNNATISSGQALSSLISTTGLSLCGIQIPATFTGTAITFQAATIAAGPYQPVYNSAGLVSYTVAAGRYLAIDPKDFYGILFLKVQSNATEAASRTLISSLKGI